MHHRDGHINYVNAPQIASQMFGGLGVFYKTNSSLYTVEGARGGSSPIDYYNQNGAAPLDGAKAEVVVSDYSGGVLTTTTTASFTNVQSMFRLKLTDGSNDISVKRLNIKSKNSAIASFFRPLYAVGSQYAYGGGVMVSPASATSDYLYVALCINEALAYGDELTFIVLSDNNKLYEGTKAAPKTVRPPRRAAGASDKTVRWPRKRESSINKLKSESLWKKTFYRFPTSRP